MTDEALVKKYRQARDMNSFKTLVRRYQNRIFNSAYHLIGNKEEAEEVVQDTFVKVHQGIDNFREDASFGAWVFRISHNLCMDILRNRKKRVAIQTIPLLARTGEETDGDFEAGVDDIADMTLEPAQVLDLKEESEIIEFSLKSLPEAQRAVLILHDLEGFQYQQIAEIIGASIGTVRSRLHYGRIKLKEMLDAYYAMKSNPVTPPITPR
ncbi:sigma-70 family RNA polymerase sigma factor [Candidatus Obscuribacterales bacterium]|nr:sigma-70 family RNA polymerase sigma factor [Candidatus Obscuribacterales bacterium]MBX3136810.1 sigma-70 family RNA polymerase sigma factor [Candidatus Obscuribacterales bacterium]MBX3150525.1 sigma-70 family RNA polymerase sigma factor [Candidatus Obscuribacterales bacterium]